MLRGLARSPLLPRAALGLPRRWASAPLSAPPPPFLNGAVHPRSPKPDVVEIIGPKSCDKVEVGHTLTGKYRSQYKRRPRYQWYRHRGGIVQPIPDATDVVYRTTFQDADAQVSFTVTFAKPDGTVDVLQSPPRAVADIYLHHLLQRPRPGFTLPPKLLRQCTALGEVDDPGSFWRTASPLAKFLVTPSEEWFQAQGAELQRILEERSVNEEYFAAEGPCDPLRDMIMERFQGYHEIAHSLVLLQHFGQFVDLTPEEKVATYHYCAGWKEKLHTFCEITDLLLKLDRPDDRPAPTPAALMARVHGSLLMRDDKVTSLRGANVNRAALFLHITLVRASQAGDLGLAMLVLAAKEVHFGRTHHTTYEYHYWDHCLLRITYLAWRAALTDHIRVQGWQDLQKEAEAARRPKSGLLQQRLHAVQARDRDELKLQLVKRREAQARRGPLTRTPLGGQAPAENPKSGAGQSAASLHDPGPNPRPPSPELPP